MEIGLTTSAGVIVFTERKKGFSFFFHQVSVLFRFDCSKGSRFWGSEPGTCDGGLQQKKNDVTSERGRRVGGWGVVGICDLLSGLFSIHLVITRIIRQKCSLIMKFLLQDGLLKSEFLQVQQVTSNQHGHSQHQQSTK